MPILVENLKNAKQSIGFSIFSGVQSRTDERTKTARQ
jgi:hypothetical protein